MLFSRCLVGTTINTQKLFNTEKERKKNGKFLALLPHTFLVRIGFLKNLQQITSITFVFLSANFLRLGGMVPHTYVHACIHCTLRCALLHYIALHCNILHCICTALHLHCIVLHCTASTFHSIALQCIDIALHCIANSRFFLPFPLLSWLDKRRINVGICIPIYEL